MARTRDKVQWVMRVREEVVDQLVEKGLAPGADAIATLTLAVVMEEVIEALEAIKRDIP